MQQALQTQTLLEALKSTTTPVPVSRPEAADGKYALRPGCLTQEGDTRHMLLKRPWSARPDDLQNTSIWDEEL